MKLINLLKPKKHKDYRLNLSYKIINKTSKIALLLCIALFLFSFSYSLHSLNIIDIHNYDNFPIKKQQIINKEFNSHNYKTLKNDINEVNSRIDNIYMWGVVFASLIFAVGFYQIYSSRKVAEEVAKSELYDLEEIIDKSFKKTKEMANYVSDIYTKTELEKEKGNVSKD